MPAPEQSQQPLLLRLTSDGPYFKAEDVLKSFTELLKLAQKNIDARHLDRAQSFSKMMAREPLMLSLLDCICHRRYRIGEMRVEFCVNEETRTSPQTDQPLPRLLRYSAHGKHGRKASIQIKGKDEIYGEFRIDDELAATTLPTDKLRNANTDD